MYIVIKYSQVYGEIRSRFSINNCIRIIYLLVIIYLWPLVFVVLKNTNHFHSDLVSDLPGEPGQKIWMFDSTLSL